MIRRRKDPDYFKLNLSFGGPDRQWESYAFSEVFAVLFGQRPPDTGTVRGRHVARAARSIAHVVQRDAKDAKRRVRR